MTPAELAARRAGLRLVRLAGGAEGLGDAQARGRAARTRRSRRSRRSTRRRRSRRCRPGRPSTSPTTPRRSWSTAVRGRRASTSAPTTCCRARRPQRPRWKRAVAFVERAAWARRSAELYVGAVLPAGGQGQDRRPGRRAARGAGGADRPGRLDERRDQGQGARQARPVHREDRLSRQVARLFGALTVSPDDLVGDARASRRSSGTASVKRLNEPVDRTEWGMTPQTVNAYYDAVQNEIVFPAAILQPPVLRSRRRPGGQLWRASARRSATR